MPPPSPVNSHPQLALDKISDSKNKPFFAIFRRQNGLRTFATSRTLTRNDNINYNTRTPHLRVNMYEAVESLLRIDDAVDDDVCCGCGGSCGGVVFIVRM